MKVHDSTDGRKTVRQWALRGYLPIVGANGVELWANRNYQDSYVYYSTEEVREATPEELKEFFRPERERRNALAKRRRDRQRKLREQQREEEQKEEKRQIIAEAVTPYIRKISELKKIIRSLTEDAPTTDGSKTLVIDTETTGLDLEFDELLQVSIIDSDGNTLFDSYVKPSFHDSWTEAERINHISPEIVKDAPTISDIIVDINSIVCHAKEIIGYNVNFDINFLRSYGMILPESVNIIDVMPAFSEIYGEYSEYFGNYKWQKLTTAAEYYNYNWNSQPSGAHNSLADCYATLHVYNNLFR
ncbi:MAG TPA: hypothetical protein DEP65_01810 [Ruminococcus sp.]|nr:hypothetical protein [Ruminococcus sp.]